jgi:hypothetical protein
MREFFKGWRRKVGAVSLVVALLLIGGYIRSYLVVDSFHFPIKNRMHCLGSFYGYLSWAAYDAAPQDCFTGFRKTPAKRPTAMLLTMMLGSNTYVRQWAISYLWLATPVTLLSAYLILWKPRTKPKGTPDA